MCAAAAALTVAVPACADTVQQVFERYKMTGTFAADCDKPAGPGNMYQVIRIADANSTQIDAMSGTTTRVATIFVDWADAVSPTVLRFVGTLNDVPIEGEFQVELQRQRVTKIRANGVDIAGEGAWFNRCKAP